MQLLKIAFGDPAPAKSNLASSLGLSKGFFLGYILNFENMARVLTKSLWGKRVPAHEMVDMRDVSPSCKCNLPSFLLGSKPIAHFLN